MTLNVSQVNILHGPFSLITIQDISKNLEECGNILWMALDMVVQQVKTIIFSFCLNNLDFPSKFDQVFPSSHSCFI